MHFHVGQKVVCVDGRARSVWHVDTIAPVTGSTYEVAAIGLTNGNDPGLKLVGLELTGNNGRITGRSFKDVFFGAWRFRPVIERSTDAGMAILRKVADDASKKIREKA